jgi:hypothetical protein
LIIAHPPSCAPSLYAALLSALSGGCRGSLGSLSLVSLPSEEDRLPGRARGFMAGFPYPALFSGSLEPPAYSTMGTLTPARLQRYIQQPPGRSPHLTRSIFASFHPQPRGSSDHRFSRLDSVAGVFRASPVNRKLARTPRRIGFVILRTDASPRIASHPASRRRSYFWLRSLRLAPARTFTVQVERHHGRTIPDRVRNDGSMIHNKQGNTAEQRNNRISQ